MNQAARTVALQRPAPAQRGLDRSRIRRGARACGRSVVRSWRGCGRRVERCFAFVRCLGRRSRGTASTTCSARSAACGCPCTSCTRRARAWPTSAPGLGGLQRGGECVRRRLVGLLRHGRVQPLPSFLPGDDPSHGPVLSAAHSPTSPRCLRPFPSPSLPHPPRGEPRCIPRRNPRPAQAPPLCREVPIAATGRQCVRMPTDDSYARTVFDYGDEAIGAPASAKPRPSAQHGGPRPRPQSAGASRHSALSP